MRVLALDTTTRAGSVALIEDDRVIAEHAGDPSRSHAERLPGDLMRLLEEFGLAPSDVDVFAVAAGPGSFTGLRIGIATMQGLAFVCRRSIVAVSVLDALAQQAARELSPGSLVGVWMDAHRHEVFSALYRVSDASAFAAERLVEEEAARAGDPAATLARWASLPSFPGVAVYIGDGAEAYASLIGAMPRKARVAAAPAVAGTIGLMAVLRAKRGETVDPAGVQPIYVRRPDVEVKRDEKKDLTTKDTKVERD
jgi:tRNA threonylcarbamoyladenosine biosynthesis protein TsaB